MKNGNFDSLEKRAIAFGRYIVENGATVRQTAKEFNISKSTIHKDVYGLLKQTDPFLYEQAKSVLDKNKKERHLRGGMATKLKFQKAKNINWFYYHRKKLTNIFGEFFINCF